MTATDRPSGTSRLMVTTETAVSTPDRGRPPYSIVVPCFNEISSIEATINALSEIASPVDAEIIVVDDGSTDGTSQRLAEIAGSRAIPGLRVVHQGVNHGYGAAIGAGVRRSRAELVVIIDADGTYPCERIPELVNAAQSADMVVGSRTEGKNPQPWLRRFAKSVLRGHCSWLVGERIPDLNSGLRVFHRSAFDRFSKILPSGFSLTTTLTVAMMRNRYSVVFIPITYAERVGESKIRPIADTLGFIQLILRTGMYFAPLRVLAPLVTALALGFLVSLGYDVLVLDDLTDKTLMLLLFVMNTVLFALLADMIDKRS
ncbi:MAG: glycosyltransferase family 2 protein [Thermoanaerobaculales bacterium]|nr:glycosyltransferase family 2 protein [Thermoanaerobaculales bacterium]